MNTRVTQGINGEYLVDRGPEDEPSKSVFDMDRIMQSIRNFATVSEALRILGAAVLLASMSLFLLQGLERRQRHSSLPDAPYTDRPACRCRFRSEPRIKGSKGRTSVFRSRACFDTCELHDSGCVNLLCVSVGRWTNNVPRLCDMAN